MAPTEEEITQQMLEEQQKEIEDLCNKVESLERSLFLQNSAAEREASDAKSKLYAIINTTGADCIRKYVGTDIADEIITAERNRIDTYRDWAKAAKNALMALVDHLPRCAAEDMGGWPACNKPGTHGPNKAYLERHKDDPLCHADLNVYCREHAKESFRGRPEKYNEELQYATFLPPEET